MFNAKKVTQWAIIKVKIVKTKDKKKILKISNRREDTLTKEQQYNCIKTVAEDTRLAFEECWNSLGLSI